MERIAYISNSASGELTGRVRWWDQLKLEGFEVTFILPKYEAEYIKRIEKLGVSVLGWSLLRSRRNIINKLAAIYKLAKILKREEFTLVHSFAHEPNIYTDIASLLAGQNYVVNTITGLGSAFIEPSFTGKVITKIYMLFEPRVNRYTFENEEDYDFFSFVPKEKRKVIYGAGVDTSYYSKEEVREDDLNEIRSILAIKPEDLIVIYIGRLLKYKGISELVEAWSVLNIDNARLLLVGEIDKDSPSSFTEEEIEELGRTKNVSFLGRREDIRELLAISDIFINPSYREGFPRTNLEAMSMEKPIITTDTVGCRYTVEDGANGMLVEVNSSEALVSAISKLAESRELREQMGIESRRIVLEKYSLDYVVKEYVGLYQDIIG